MKYANLPIAVNLDLPIDAATQTFAFLGKRGGGKALALDTRLPTPTGWTTMGEVKEGDELFDEKGQPCRVTYVAPIQLRNRCFRLRFSDDSEIVADAEHLWLTETLASRRADVQAKYHENRGRGNRPQCERRCFPALVTTAQIAETLLTNTARKDRNHSIQTTEPIICPERDLPIHPYLLGVWLGDGTSVESAITTADIEVIDKISQFGYTVWEIQSQRQENCGTYRISGKKFRENLRALNLLGNKHIPNYYLRSSIEQRQLLLAGLMDSDGYISKDKNTCYFYNMNETLADAAAELVVSLGWKATKNKKRATLHGVVHGECFVISFRPSVNPFLLARKKNRFSPDVAQSSRAKRRMIIAVDKVSSVPVRCIAVDSPSRLFLAGDSMIPTHNTYAAMKLAELMLDAGVQIVAFDPVGKWYGLRIPGEGRNAKGYDIPVFGGLNGDLPLQPHAGALIADLIIERNISAVIDVSQFLLSEQTRFMLDFIQQFFQRKKSQPSPVHLFIEECQEFIPQQIGKSEVNAAKLLHHFERTVKLGRNFGIGASMISQRPQEVNKKVLNQTEVLFVFQMTGLQERKTIEEWTRTKGIEVNVKDELPTLQQGIARVWSPSWLFVNDLYRVLPKRSADVSATPTATSYKIETKPLTNVDVENLKQAMHVIVEEADRKDPIKLQKKIRELEKQLAVVEKKIPETKIETVEIPVITDEHINQMWEFSKGLFKAVDQLTGLMTNFDSILTKVVEAKKKQQHLNQKPRFKYALEQLGVETIVATKQQGEIRPPLFTLRYHKPKSDAIGNFKPKKSSANQNLTQPQQRILNALAAFETLGMSPVKRINVAFFAGYTENGHFNNCVGSLRNAGLVDYPAGGMLSLTVDGRALAQADENEIQTLDDLHRTWQSKLSMPEQKILSVLIEIYPDEISRADLASRTGYTENGHFNNTVGHLKTLGVAFYPRGGCVAATDVLFPEALI